MMHRRLGGSVGGPPPTAPACTRCARGRGCSSSAAVAFMSLAHAFAGNVVKAVGIQVLGSRLCGQSGQADRQASRVVKEASDLVGTDGSGAAVERGSRRQGAGIARRAFGFGPQAEEIQVFLPVWMAATAAAPLGTRRSRRSSRGRTTCLAPTAQAGPTPRSWRRPRGC